MYCWGGASAISVLRRHPLSQNSAVSTSRAVQASPSCESAARRLSTMLMYRPYRPGRGPQLNPQDVERLLHTTVIHGHAIWRSGEQESRRERIACSESR